ncbi:MAG: helix-turn-helix transcriptional regulator [Eubacterium sp.]|nr:helix-turn-helix transcriptional regulator [Eubacterium sp.]
MNLTINTDRLIECRIKKGITKMEAAKRMNLSQPAYLRYENGDRVPSIQTLTIIADVLNTSIEYLTDKTNDPSPNLIILKKDDNPALFDFLELSRADNRREELIKRMQLYIEALSKNSQNKEKS